VCSSDLALARQDECDRAVALATEWEKDGQSAIDAELRRAVTYEKAWCLRGSGDTERAAESYRALLDEPSDGELNVHASLELGVIEAEAERFERAAELLRSIRDAADNGNVVPVEVLEPALYRLGTCEFELKQYEAAASAFRQLIDVFPQSELVASASYYAGESLHRIDKHEDAVPFLTRVTADHGDDPVVAPALLRLGESLAHVQRWGPSELAFMNYLDRFGDTQQWYQAAFGVGWARENQKRYDEAIKSYQQVVARHQGETAARAQFQIGECLFAQKQYESAARELLKVDILYAYPEWTAAALYEAGRCLAMVNKSAEAKDQFRRVVEQHGETRWAELATQRLGELSASASVMGK